MNTAMTVTAISRTNASVSPTANPTLFSLPPILGKAVVGYTATEI